MMTHDVWLQRHPYLRPVASLRSFVDAAALRLTSPAAREPDWDGYLADFTSGTPLLHSELAAIEVSDPAELVRAMLKSLLSMPLPDAFANQCRELQAGLGENDGLFRYLLWAALSRDLKPLVAAFARWRDEERWLRNYCPMCGEAPAMAQLVGKDPGRMRMLFCGCCGTRWRYRRTGCPFCERKDDHRLSVLGVEGEGGLRIDYCDGCHGYLKTYDGEGGEAVLLADWTSLHLDLLARDRGLKRLAASLYEV